MSIGAALYTYLSAQAGLTALTSTRIYPSQAPENVTYPYIVHNRVSERRFGHLGGPSGMVRARWQLDIFASTDVSADAVFQQLRDVLDGFRQSTMGSENVLSVNLDDMRTDLTPPDDDSDAGVHRISSDWIFLYGETDTSV